MNRSLYRHASVLALAFFLATLSACDDDASEDGSNLQGDYAPASEKELEEWVESQDVIMAPWAHEIDEDILDAAIIEEDRLVFADSEQNQWLLDIEPGEIIHGFSEEHMVMVLDRVESVEQGDEGIVFKTRVADITELYLKLTPGAPIDTKYAHRPQPLAEQDTEAGEPAQPDVFDPQDMQQRDSQLTGAWTFTDVALLQPSMTLEGGLCTERKHDGTYETRKPCPSFSMTDQHQLINMALEKPEDDSSEKPEGMINEYDAAVLAKATVESGYSFKGGTIAIDIDLWESAADKGAVCVLQNYSLMELMLAEIRNIVHDPENAERFGRNQAARNHAINTNPVVREYVDTLSLVCGHFKPEVYEFNTWKERYLRTIQNDSGGSENVHERNFVGIWRENLNQHVNRLRGRNKGFRLAGTVEVGISNPLLELALAFNVSSSGKSKIIDDDKIPALDLELPAAVGPVVAVVGIKVPLKVLFELAGQVGFRWSGDNSAKLALGIDLDIAWDPNHGWSYDFDFHDASHFWSKPYIFGAFEASMSVSLPMKLSFKLWRAIGPFLQMEPYFKGSGKIERSALSSEITCLLEISLGAKASVGGSIEVPAIGKIAELSGLLVDTCNPGSPDAILPRVIQEKLNWCGTARQDVCARPDKFVQIELDGDANVGDKGGPPFDKINIAQISLQRHLSGEVVYPETVYIDGSQAPDHRAAELLRTSDRSEFECTADPDWESYIVSFSEKLQLEFAEKIEVGDTLYLGRIADSQPGDDGELYECVTGGEFAVSVGDGEDWGVRSKAPAEPFGTYKVTDDCGGDERLRGVDMRLCGVR